MKTFEERLREAELCNWEGPMTQIMNEGPIPKLKQTKARIDGIKLYKKNFATDAATQRSNYEYQK